MNKRANESIYEYNKSRVWDTTSTVEEARKEGAIAPSSNAVVIGYIAIKASPWKQRQSEE